MADPWADFLNPTPAARPKVDPWADFVAPAAPVAASVAPAYDDFPLSAPPPGAIIHGLDGKSFVADHPEISVARTAPAGSRDEAVEMQALKARGATAGPLGDVARAGQPFTQGQSLNYGDEIISAIFGAGSAATGGSFRDAYDYGQEFQRQELDRRRAEAPVTSLASEIAGGFATGAAAAPRVFASGAGLAVNALRGAAAGAAGGAASGFGGGSGFSGRIEDLIANGGIGAAVGGAVPLAGAAVGAGVRAYGTSRAAREILPSVGIGRRTADQLGRELERDALTPEAARAEAQRLGPNAMLLDAGDNLSGGAEAVANAPGAGNRTIRDRLRERAAGASQRITDAADEALGPQANMAETVDDLIARRTAEAGPAYRDALGTPIEWNDRLQQFIDDPVIRKGLREGVEIQRLDALAANEPWNPLDFAITGTNEAGEPIVTGVPNMRTLHAAKQGLDNIIEAYRDPTTGRLQLDTRGRAINAVQRSFLDALDGANPRYAEARRLFAGPTRVRDALSLGQDVFDNATRPDQLRQRLAGMTEDERDAFAMGARDQLSEIMGTARNDAGAARAKFETGWNREKLGLVLGDDERAAQFLDQLGAETRFANSRQAITGNSASARRLERAGEYNGQKGAARAAFDPASGLWGDTKRTFARLADSVMDGRAVRSAEEMRGEFGDAVSRQGARRDELIDAIMRYGQRRQTAANRGAATEGMMRAILSGGALAYAGAGR
ncbi:hypothetical protein [Aureimonas leprariae]|uniref:Uncharacterized protein n=1 Tax=Plantimonas leprariae TaxID=2615207 RepID=A0A7V7PMB6_9HYPH|nr:hypothetical protein [Aureimonas leprariae]KAB0678050.1 hypothetical protein F6X38_16625 [Aureimonas leprariae]